MASTLIIPGLNGSGPHHWQTWLERELPGSVRLGLHSRTPNLSTWTETNRRAITQLPQPVWIVAHGFGCLAAVRAACSLSESVAGALLVAPADPAKMHVAHRLPEIPLPFPSIVVASGNDPQCRLDRARFWAEFWNSDLFYIGAAGGIDPQSGFGPWPQGLELLAELKRTAGKHVSPPYVMHHDRNAWAL
jgi:predicted alpha/beta hydrolase family esterase